MKKNNLYVPAHKKGRHLLYILFCIFFMIASAADSAPNGENKFSDNDAAKIFSIEEINNKIKKIDENIKIIAEIKTEEAVGDVIVKPADLEKRISDLSSLKSSCERLLLSIAALNKTEKGKIDIENTYENYKIKGMLQKPPYTLSFLDTVQDKLFTAERDIENINLTIEMLVQEQDDHKERLKIIEKELRQNEETLKVTEENNHKLIRWKIEEGKINLDYLQIMIQAKTNEIKRYELEKTDRSIQISLYKEQTSFIKSNVKYDEEDLKNQIDALEKKKTNIQKEIEKFQAEQKSIENKWFTAQKEMEKAQNKEKRAVAETYFNSRNEWRKTSQIILELKENSILLMDRQIQAWQKRYALVKENLPSDRLKNLRKEVENDINSLGQALLIQQNYLINLQNESSSIERRITEEGLPEPIRTHLISHLEALRRQLDKRLEYQSMVLVVDQVKKRLLNEIINTLGQITIKEHLTGIKEDIEDFWNIEIWTVDNYSVTLRKVTFALIILTVGIIMAKFILASIYNRFLLKSQLKQTTASTVHKILSYSAYLLVCLFALRMVNIPLTAFAFLGGAVAIGIGFGTQNLLNNLISGFMILGERPINIGNLIEIDGILGMVEEIGARCTRIRTGENIHILVPNSSFLEKNITNWTLSDKTIRANVLVGVAYGTPVRKVEQLLIQSVKEVPRILKFPDPFVIFNDFGDNALMFKVYFWIEIQRVIERLQFESEVRFKIDEVFGKEGIVIAFPQRDIHFTADKPIKISLAETPKN